MEMVLLFLESWRKELERVKSVLQAQNILLAFLHYSLQTDSYKWTWNYATTTELCDLITGQQVEATWKKSQILKFVSDVLVPTSTWKLHCATLRFLDCFSLGDVTGSLSRNAGHKLPFTMRKFPKERKSQAFSC